MGKSWKYQDNEVFKSQKVKGTVSRKEDLKIRKALSQAVRRTGERLELLFED